MWYLFQKDATSYNELKRKVATHTTHQFPHDSFFGHLKESVKTRLCKTFEELKSKIYQ